MRLKLFVLCCFLCLVELTPTLANETPYNYVGYHLEAINAFRAERNLPPFGYNENLAIAANVQAEWMIANWSYAHVHGGSTPRTRALDAGYNGYNWCCSENTFISANQTPEAALNFWIRSPAHYAQLTSTYFDEIGVGFAIGSQRTGQVIVFGRREGAPESVPATNPVIAQAVSNTTAAVSTPGCSASHTIAYGETLFSISRRYNVSQSTLAAANSISNPRVIYAGTTLCIPSGSAAPAVAAAASSSSAAGTSADNWCYPGAPWGDGRCNDPNPAVQEHLWQCGWYAAHGLNSDEC